MYWLDHIRKFGGNAPKDIVGKRKSKAGVKVKTALIAQIREFLWATMIYIPIVSLTTERI